MEHPAHYFIAYLILVLDEPTLANVNSNLEGYGLSKVDQPGLSMISSELGAVPSWLKVYDSRDGKSTRWLRKRKVYSLFHPDQATQEMRNSILVSPRLREKIETLILGNVSPREASYRLKKLGHLVSHLAYSEYRHYFWNTEMMGVSGWAAYLERDSTKRTSELSPFYMAAIRGGSEVAMYRVGVSKELDIKKALVEMAQEFYHCFLEVKELPTTPKKIEMLATITRGISRIDERLDSSDTALQDVLKRFEQFKVRADTDKIPTMVALAPSGSISGKSRAEITSTRK